MSTAPSVPSSFMQRLKSLDRRLGLEWLNDHWCVVDESNVIREYQVKHDGLVAYTENKKLYDRIHHVPEGHLLDGAVLDKLRSMNMKRWNRKEDFKAEIENQIKKAEHSRKSTERDFADDVASNVKTLNRFGVVVPGFKDEKKCLSL